MYHYALALRRSSFLMVNSSWTKNHVDAILAHADPFLDLIHFPLNFFGGLALSLIHVLAHSSPTHAHVTPKRAAIVYPPCDTHALSQFPLDRRPSLLLSLAQFRYDFIPFFYPLVLIGGKTGKGSRCADPHDGRAAETVSGAQPGCAPSPCRRSAQCGGFCARRRVKSARGLTPGHRM